MKINSTIFTSLLVSCLGLILVISNGSPVRADLGDDPELQVSGTGTAEVTTEDYYSEPESVKLTTTASAD